MNFQTEVIEASKNRPILVDFWAPWCGPCQFLGPILEKLEESQSKWKLIKVNVDENPDISQEYGIRGIPDVRLFIDGKVAGQLTGAKPQHEIEKWLEEMIPDERIAIVKELEEKRATEKLKKFVEENPDLDLGRLALSRMILWDNPEYVLNLLKDIRAGHVLFSQAEDLRILAGFIQSDFDATSKVSTLLNQARVLADNEFEKGMDLIIQAVIMDKSFQNELPRRLAIALFGYLGPDHEVTTKYRRRFDMALY